MVGGTYGPNADGWLVELGGVDWYGTGGDGRVAGRKQFARGEIAEDAVRGRVALW